MSVFCYASYFLRGVYFETGKNQMPLILMVLFFDFSELTMQPIKYKEHPSFQKSITPASLPFLEYFSVNLIERKEAKINSYLCLCVYMRGTGHLLQCLKE